METFYVWKKCVCKKTHTSGDDIFEENSVYKYKENYWTFSVYRDTITRDYKYLEGDFNKYFVDLAKLLDKQLEEILKD